MCITPLPATIQCCKEQQSKLQIFPPVLVCMACPGRSQQQCWRQNIVAQHITFPSPLQLDLVSFHDLPYLLTVDDISRILGYGMVRGIQNHNRCYSTASLLGCKGNVHAVKFPHCSTFNKKANSPTGSTCFIQAGNNCLVSTAFHILPECCILSSQQPTGLHHC